MELTIKTHISKRTALHSITTGVGAYVVTRKVYKTIHEIRQRRRLRKEKEELLDKLSLGELEELNQLLKELESIYPSVTH